MSLSPFGAPLINWCNLSLSSAPYGKAAVPRIGEIHLVRQRESETQLFFTSSASFHSHIRHHGLQHLLHHCQPTRLNQQLCDGVSVRQRELRR